MTSRVLLSALDEKSLTKILETYKELPCLWDTRHKDYSKQVERKKAFDILMSKINVDGVQIPAAAIKKKLQNMRSFYIHEYRKVMAASAKGERYVPTLWYYNLFNFINGAEDITDHSFAGPDNEDLEDCESLEDIEDFKVKDFKPKECKMEENYLKDNDDSKHECQVTSTSTPMDSNDEAAAFGETLGLQLQKLNAYQRTIAEKLIADTVFYARMNKLNSFTLLALNEE